MKNKEFKELIKNKQYKKIINDYINSKIFLTNVQLEKVIALKNAKHNTN